MKTLFLSFLLISTISLTHAQTLSGVWHTETDDETAVFDQNGNFLIHWAAKGLNAAGSYTFNGSTLRCTFNDGGQQVYSISQLTPGQGFLMTDTESGQTWWYTYQGEANTLSAAQNNTAGAVSNAEFSGIYFCAEENEKILLSASEYFEAQTPQQQSYGIWGVKGDQLVLAFANYGNIVELPIVDFARGQYFTIQLQDEKGAQVQKTYRYQSTAPTYPQDQVQQVVAQFTNASNQSFQTQLQMQNTMHNTTMSIIHAMGGYDTEYVVKDAYGNVIRRY